MRLFPALACIALAVAPSAVASAAVSSPAVSSLAVSPAGPLPILLAGGLASPNQDDSKIPEKVEEQAKALQDGTQKERTEAIKKLAAYGGPEATAFVVAALGDADPNVADMAQTVLPDLETPDLLERLQGRDGLKSKDPLVRSRVAEAIGRFTGPVDAQVLLRAVKKRDVQLSRMLLWSLERLAQQGALSGKPQRTIKAVRMLTGRGDNDRVRAAAMQVLSQLDPHDGAISLDNLSVGCGLETASCLMDTFERLKPRGYVGAIVRGLSHPNAGVRMRAIDVLMRSGVTRATLTSMVNQLEVEPRAGVRRRLVVALRYFTGEPLGEEAGPWKAFTNDLKPGWTTAETTAAIRDRPRVFGDIDILRKVAPTSDRVAVLLDVSAGFWAPRENGPSQAELLLPEIDGILRRLDQTGTFFLVPFGNEPKPWSEKPIDATPANTRAAGRYLLEELAQATPKDQGSNIHAAISKALEFEELDSIVVITGSSTYVGKHGSAAMMVRLFEEQSRFRPAIFDFVLLGPVAYNASRWTRLAASRGGRLYTVNLR